MLTAIMACPIRVSGQPLLGQLPLPFMGQVPEGAAAAMARRIGDGFQECVWGVSALVSRRVEVVSVSGLARPAQMRMEQECAPTPNDSQLSSSRSVGKDLASACSARGVSGEHGVARV